MEDVTTFLSLTTGVFPIACKTESRIGLLCAMVFSPRPAAAYAFGIGCSKIHIGKRRPNWSGGDVVPRFESLYSLWLFGPANDDAVRQGFEQAGPKKEG